jgi:ATP-binding cassette subfamily F protein 3
MVIAQLSEISKAFGSQEVLERVHWQIADDDRVALVGRNGAGKTTLFRILAGDLEPDAGTMWIRRGAVVAAMEQEVRVEGSRTLREEAARGLEHVQELERELESVTARLASVGEGDAEAMELVERYGHLQERLEREGGYAFEARIKSVLEGLHFRETDLDRPLAEFSGGQKSRAILARVLLRDPDLLLLDEPTNHLDLAAIEWLEDFLSEYRGAFVLVSHDRTFVNRLARKVAELRYRRLHHFQGNYDAFLGERERRLEEQAKKYELQQTEIQRQEEFIRRNIAGQKTKQAQSRRKMLERLERLEAPEWPASSIRLRLPEPARTGRVVLEVKDLAKAYGAIPVFRGVTFQQLRGEKVGLIGPNGVGKTTLVRILIGEESPDRGTVRIGTGVQIGYQEQEQKKLVGATSVLEEVWSVTPQATENELRTYLGGFLFRGDDVFKPLNALSGGEKSRVALAKLVREGANVLVLDEPTNHLDIESREVIERALQAFRGTVLVVSHDRYFLDRVVDHVLELRADGCRKWEGTYSQMAAARQARSEAAASAAPRTPSTAASASASPSFARKRPDPPKLGRAEAYEVQKQHKREEERLRRRVADAEASIASLEATREGLQLEMADPSAATDALRLAALQEKLDGVEGEIRAAIRAWEDASIRLEGFLDTPKS